MKKFGIFLFCTLAIVCAANARVAKPGFNTFTQPDGSTITLELRGNQHAHYYITEDNVPVMLGDDGFFRYIDVAGDGTIRLSAMPAQNAIARSVDAMVFTRNISLDKVQNVLSGNASERLNKRARVAPQYGVGLFNGHNYPRKGEVRSLVFLVEYQDVKFNTPDPADYFHHMLNDEGFSLNGSTGSARDFFYDQSSGQFSVQFDVFGPVTLSENRRYYGGNDIYGNDMRPEEMVSEAAVLLDDVINYADYDLDNDGNVDNIFLIYAGTGEASYGPAESVWPHQWQLYSRLVLDGKRIYGYACHNEWERNSPAGIGGICHEYSHVMGLPDLYSTTNYLTCTPGAWDTMDTGNYNNDSHTPAAFSAFERNALGWMEPIIVDGPETITLEPLNTGNTAYLIPTEKDTEFFLIENRQQTGWDKYLPYHGMLIWHIDYNQSIWQNNTVNDNRNHQYVDIEEANNNPSTSVIVMRGHPYPGSSNKTSFTANTVPSMKSWANKAIDFPITDITENADGTITFKIKGGRLVTPEAPELTATETGTIVVKWKAVSNASNYLLDVYTKDSEGNAVPFADYTDYSVGNTTEYTVEGVAEKTTYYITVKSAQGSSHSYASDEASVTTPELEFVYKTPVAIGGSCSNGSEVSLYWEPLDDATKYLLTIEAEVLDGTETITVDFGADNTLSLPEGWIWSGAATDIYKSTSTSYFGQSAPSLKMSTSGANLVSPVFENGISNVSFWLKGASANALSFFNVDGRSSEDDEWQTLYSVNPLSELNSKGETQQFEPGLDCRQLRFIYIKSTGNAALDDIVLTIPSMSFKLTDDYNRTDVGNTTEHTCLIGAEAISIRFYIEAQNAAGETSRRSNSVAVALKEGASLSDVEVAPAASVKVYGNTIQLSAEANTAVQVFNTSGVAVAQGRTDADGKAVFTLPAGFYIVATPGSATKVIIK